LPEGGSFQQLEEIQLTLCTSCKRYSLWHEGKMLYPDALDVAPPCPHLDKGIQADYLEAASILAKSPRGAAALLRLCLQKLCQQVGETGENINDDISSLVAKGLPPQIQQALDIVRVVGNNAVHPGQIDLKDDAETASRLFELINLIAQVMITQPKDVEALYSKLPEKQREAIEKRNGRSS